MSTEPITLALQAANAPGRPDGENGKAFDNALSNAASAAGGNDAQLQQKMIEAATQVMGGIMMRHAGEVLSAGMEDDGE
jgi:hypothetical protein